MPQIGHVEILVDRVYPLDITNEKADAPTGYIPVGTYPVFQEGAFIFWVVSGSLNKRGLQSLGDGMFVMTNADAPSDIPVTFPSKRFSLEHFEEFLQSELCLEGSGEQRLRFLLDGDILSPKEMERVMEEAGVEDFFNGA